MSAEAGLTERLASVLAEEVAAADQPPAPRQGEHPFSPPNVGMFCTHPIPTMRECGLAASDPVHAPRQDDEQAAGGLTEDGQANDCTHGSATGIDMTSPRDPAKVWACDHCGLRWRSDGQPLAASTERGQ